MFFRKKKQKAKEEQAHNSYQMNDKSVHRAFQAGALLLAAYIGYTLFFGKAGLEEGFSSSDAHYMSDEQINAKVQAAVSQLANSPEFREIKEFSALTQNNIDKDHAKILNVREGVLVFIPNEMLAENKSDVKVENETLKLDITSEKKTASAEGAPEEKTQDKTSGASEDNPKDPAAAENSSVKPGKASGKRSHSKKNTSDDAAFRATDTAEKPVAPAAAKDNSEQ